MKRFLTVLATLLAVAASVGGQAAPAPQQAAAPAAANAPTVAVDLPRRIETYLRELFALGPNYQMKVGAAAPAAMPGLFQVTVEVSSAGQTDNLVVYVTADGRYLLRGELHDTAGNLFAGNRNRIKTENFPSKGPADAKVTIVEYADFQCPGCRQMRDALKQVLPKYPTVRLVFKDLPLAQIHPWAMTAALGARCAYSQSPDAFWKLHDLFFDQQEQITPTNAYAKTLEFAAGAGLDVGTFRFCMTSSEAKTPIEASVNEARALSVANTPTLFVNGRRIVTVDVPLLEQYLQYELGKARAAATPAAPPAAPPKP
jgi:protein-disulfide isomerase